MSHHEIASKLLKDRILILGSVVTDEVANLLVAQMLYLEEEDPNRDIQLYINSPGGSVTAGLAIYDLMQFIKCDVSTFCFGMAASMGSFLLAAGAPGKRFAMPNARVLIHQPHLGDGKLGGQVTDIEIHARELVRTKEKVTEIYARHTGMPAAELALKMERDLYLTAEDAKALGLIDGVITARKNGLRSAG